MPGVRDAVKRLGTGVATRRAGVAAVGPLPSHLPRRPVVPTPPSVAGTLGAGSTTTTVASLTRRRATSAVVVPPSQGQVQRREEGPQSVPAPTPAPVSSLSPGRGAPAPPSTAPRQCAASLPTRTGRIGGSSSSSSSSSSTIAFGTRVLGTGSACTSARPPVAARSSSADRWSRSTPRSPALTWPGGVRQPRATTPGGLGPDLEGAPHQVSAPGAASAAPAAAASSVPSPVQTRPRGRSTSVGPAGTRGGEPTSMHGTRSRHGQVAGHGVGPGSSNGRVGPGVGSRRAGKRGTLSCCWMQPSASSTPLHKR